MEFSFWLKLTVILLGFALAAVEFDFFKDLKNEKVKKKLLGIIFITLLLFTLFDTTNDEVVSKKTDKKRDSLITIDSLRFAKIVSNFRTNLNSLTETKDEIVTLDSLLSDVKKTVQNQVGLLNDAVKKSEKLVKLEGMKFQSKRPKIISVGGKPIFKLDLLGNIEEVKITFGNIGGRIATNVESSPQMMFYSPNLNTMLNVPDDFSPTKFSGISLLGEMAPRSSTIMTLKPLITKDMFKSENYFLFIVVVFNYNDAFGNAYTDYYNIGLTYSDGRIKTYSGFTSEIKQRIKVFLIENRGEEFKDYQ